MTTSSVEIVEAGWSGITDLGRYGYTDQGVQVNGAADQFSAMAANILVGNSERSPLIEITAILPFRMRTHDPMLVAVTGAMGKISVNGVAFPGNTPIVTWPGARVQIEPARAGLRSYVAIHGGVAGDEFLGSYAHDSLINRGRRLSDGDTVEVDGHRVHAPPHMASYFPISGPHDTYSHHTRLGIVPGPEQGEFPDFLNNISIQPLTVGAQSDHAGIRLEGMPVTRSGNDEILSRGVPVGAIEAPQAGGLITLLRGRPLTAGYPVPALVARGWHHRLAQVRPGDSVSLIPTTVSRSLTIAQTRRDELDLLHQRCSTAFAASRIFASCTSPI